MAPVGWLRASLKPFRSVPPGPWFHSPQFSAMLYAGIGVGVGKCKPDTHKPVFYQKLHVFAYDTQCKQKQDMKSTCQI